MSAAGRRDAQVIVAGGGPAGAYTAWALASAGVDVLVVDRARFPRDKPCSEYLSPEASRLLHAMGALDAVERLGPARLTGMRVLAPGGRVIHGEFLAAHGWRGFTDYGLAIRRTLLDAVLLDRARQAGARVLEGARVRDLLRDGDRVAGVRVETDAGPRELRAPLVVGADGLRSVVARRLGLAQVGWPRRIALVTHHAGVRDLGDAGEMTVERGGYHGIVHVGGGVANVAIVVPAARARELSGDPAAFVDRWIAERPALRERFAGAERVAPVYATGPFASHARRGWAPGAALVGDAADFFDPFTGEGIYAALRGAELLAPRLLAALAAPATVAADAELARYDRERRAAFRGKWVVERLVGGAVAFPALLDRTARVLARRKDMADLLVGVTGDFVPPREVLRPRYLLRLMTGLLLPA